MTWSNNIARIGEKVEIVILKMLLLAFILVPLNLSTPWKTYTRRLVVILLASPRNDVPEDSRSFLTGVEGDWRRRWEDRSKLKAS